MQENKEYTTPELVVFGNVEELTQGECYGVADWFRGGGIGSGGDGFGHDLGCPTGGSGS